LSRSAGNRKITEEKEKNRRGKEPVRPGVLAEKRALERPGAS